MNYGNCVKKATAATKKIWEGMIAFNTVAWLRENT